LDQLPSFAHPFRDVEFVAGDERAASRGVYSGCIGYQNPDGDFDLNVVIRTLLQNDDTGEVHATVGGAITLLSEGANEYEECLLKAEALRQCLHDEE
jgi:para-aminobenzoate synthetase component 1